MLELAVAVLAAALFELQRTLARLAITLGEAALVAIGGAVLALDLLLFAIVHAAP
jgi:hypothetical protein